MRRSSNLLVTNPGLGDNAISPITAGRRVPGGWEKSTNSTRFQIIDSMAKTKPITFDYQGALIPEHGITTEDIEQLVPSLEAARQEMLKTDLELLASGADVPTEKQPLDAAFHEMPERILDEFE